MISGCCSVTMYWCSTGITGIVEADHRAGRRAKLPVAETTCSQVMSPWSVETSHSPFGFWVIAVTVVLRWIVAPSCRAPFASAWVRSAGWI